SRSSSSDEKPVRSRSKSICCSCASSTGSLSSSHWDRVAVWLLARGDAFGRARGRAPGGGAGNHARPGLPAPLLPGWPTDDAALLVHNDRLAEAEFTDGGRDGVHGRLVLPRVVLVGPNRFDRTQFYLHEDAPSWLHDPTDGPFSPIPPGKCQSAPRPEQPS